MKRIGIVTFFQSYNYGVWFQAYATQAFLRGRGYDAQIVNYSNLHDDEKLKMAFKGKNSYMGYLISFAKYREYRNKRAGQSFNEEGTGRIFIYQR